jgi:hypothetical protein
MAVIPAATATSLGIRMKTSPSPDPDPDEHNTHNRIEESSSDVRIQQLARAGYRLYAYRTSR